MIGNYIKIAWRQLVKFRMYSIIKILGLALGIATSLLLALYIKNEFSYDRFHENAESIVRVTMRYNITGNDKATSSTGSKVGPAMLRNFPEVKSYVRTFKRSTDIILSDRIFEDNNLLYADQDFFKIFSFGMKGEDESTVLDAPNKVVITKSCALKLFGESSPIGRTFEMRGKAMMVSGVCNDVPAHSQIQFDIVTNFKNLGNNVKTEEWWTANWYTYLLLQDDTNIVQLNEKINSFMNSPLVRKEARLEGNDYLKYNLEPLVDVHLKTGLSGLEPAGSMDNIRVLILIAVLIVIIASANYTNLAIAQSNNRNEELAMRKVMGASRSQLFAQFLGEAVLVSGLACIVSLILTFLFLPIFNVISGKFYLFEDILQFDLIGYLLIFGVVIGLMAGFYPALVISRNNINKIRNLGKKINVNPWLQKALITGQFAISIFLVLFTIFILSQMNFIKNKELGFNKNNVVVIPLSSQAKENYSLLKPAILEIEGVDFITASYDSPEYVQWSDGIRAQIGDMAKDISVTAMPVDLDFTKTLGINMAAGRDFLTSDLSNHEDEDYQQPYLINGVLAKQIGWTPEEAVGQFIESKGRGAIVGVVNDFNFNSLHIPIGPMMIFLRRDMSRNLLVSINSSDVSVTLNSIKNIYNRYANDQIFRYHYLDEKYESLYTAEVRTFKVFKVASIIAIFLALIGLFGLAAFTTELRKKEIGIRKTLGAEVIDIVLLIGRKFLFLICLSLILAIPVGWYFGSEWLNNFAFRTSPSYLWILWVILSALILTLLTVGFHAARSALSNPVNTLRVD